MVLNGPGIGEGLVERGLAHAFFFSSRDFFEQLPAAVILEDVDIILLVDVGIKLAGLEPCAPVELDVIVVCTGLAGRSLGGEECLVEQHAGLEAVAILLVPIGGVLIVPLGSHKLFCVHKRVICIIPRVNVDSVAVGVILQATETLVGHEQRELGQCRGLVTVQLDVMRRSALLEHTVAVMLDTLDLSVIQFLGLELRFAGRDNLVGHTERRATSARATSASL